MRRSAIGTAIALSMALSVLAGPAPVSAETTISVAPALLDLAGSTGGLGRVEITIGNEGDLPFDVAPKVIELESAGALDLPSASEWVRVSPERQQVAPGATGSVGLDLDIPRDIEPGGHYVAIAIDAAPSRAASGTGVSGRIVVPVFITVDDADPETPTPVARPVLLRSAMFLEQDGRYRPRIELANEGDTHATLAGDVVISLPGEAEPVRIIDVPVARVLPTGTRVVPGDVPVALEADQTYAADLTLGRPDAGRITFEPDVQDAGRFTTTPDITLSDLAICRAADGTYRTSVRIANAGSIGVVPGLVVGVDVPALGRAAMAYPIRDPLAWPGESIDITSVIGADLAARDYVLVAEAVVGDETLRTETAIQTGEGGTVAECEPAPADQNG